MKKWTKSLEEEITLLLKDWLKNKNMTQADLRDELKASSSRMPALLEVIQKEYSIGGISKVAKVLCSIENNWYERQKDPTKEHKESDPFNQLDLLLEELQEDIGN
tara:strand:- start:707 stop:1021 length:315 start_codon:yes stop_codon:yes gene_type:complete